MKTDLELVSEAFEAIKTVIERWEANGVPLCLLPQDVALLFSVGDRLLSAREHLKRPSLQAAIKAIGEKHAP